jgi:hypothetical protein
MLHTNPAYIPGQGVRTAGAQDPSGTIDPCAAGANSLFQSSNKQFRSQEIVRKSGTSGVPELSQKSTSEKT